MPVVANPPINPPHVLPGLTLGTTFLLPIILPHTNCAMSFNSVISSRYSASPAPPEPWAFRRAERADTPCG